MAESWSAARASHFPSFPREVLPFPPHWAGLKGCPVPGGPTFRGHTIPGGLEPRPQATYTLQFGGISSHKYIQHGSTSLRTIGVRVCHALDGLDGGLFTLSGLEGFAKHLQEKEGQGREGGHIERPGGGARLSGESRPSRGGDGCGYLCSGVEDGTAVFLLLLLCWQVPVWMWQRVSTGRAEGLRERLEDAAEPCAPQAGPAPGQGLLGTLTPVSLAAGWGWGCPVDGAWPEPCHGQQPRPLFPSFPGDVHGAWDGAKPAAATSPVAQLSHSPACSSWTSSTSSSCHAGAALVPFSSSSSSQASQASLGTLGGLSAILQRPGLKGSCRRDGRHLRKAPRMRVSRE